MGGRGAGSSRSRGSGGASISMQQQQPQPPQPTVDGQFVEGGQFSNFMKMTDDQKADVIDQLTHEQVPVFLADNDFQKLTYSVGGNDKPQIVSDAVLDRTSGTDLYRTVNRVRDTKNGITYDADMIASQVQKGSVTRVSDSGGSVYGRGIYFANNYHDSVLYGNSRGNIKSTAVVRAKLSTGTKSISYSKATQMAKAEMNSGSKLGRALRKCDSQSQVSIYAYSKGYSVITSGNGYYNILSRKGLMVSQDIKPSGSSW